MGNSGQAVQPPRRGEVMLAIGGNGSGVEQFKRRHRLGATQTLDRCCSSTRIMQIQKDGSLKPATAKDILGQERCERMKVPASTPVFVIGGHRELFKDLKPSTPGISL